MGKFVLLLLMLFGFAITANAQDEPVRSIVNVTGDLYRFQNNSHYGVFLVTDWGIILADPINSDAASWLKEELKARFGKPVKYVIYSHDHADHTSGGEVFADTAEFVGHVLAKDKIAKSAHTPEPDILVLGEKEIRLGSKRVILHYFGESHSDNLLAMEFPDERTVFLVDVVAVKRLPYRTLRDYYFPGAIEYLKEVEDLDFDILLPGHGPIGSKEHVREHRHYLETLMKKVGEGVAIGSAVEDLMVSVDLSEFSSWSQYDAWKDLNIEGMHRILTEGTTEIQELKPVYFEVPNYPRSAEKMAIEGWVLIGFDLNPDGKPLGLNVIGSGANSNTRGITKLDRFKSQFEKTAVKALEKSIFEIDAQTTGLRYLIIYQMGPSPESTGSWIERERVDRLQSLIPYD